MPVSNESSNAAVTTKTTTTTAAATNTTTDADHSSVTLQLATRESAEHMHGMDDVYQSMRNRPLIIKAYALSDDSDPQQLHSSIRMKGDNNNVKIIHFVRHGQGFHNLLADLYEEQGRKWIPYTDTPENPYTRPELLDPPLTEKGRQQALKLQPHVQALSNPPELVVISPLCRALQTGILAFEKLWLDNHKKVPFVSHEMAREEHGVHVCDQRQSTSRLKAEFPMVDFSFIEHEHDVLFRNDQRETKQQVGERVYNFMTWLAQRPERHIGVVSHSGWLLTVLNGICECGDDKLKAWFQTGEMRSVMLQFIDNPEHQQCSK